MGVSLTGLAVKSARVQSAYVETAQECFPAIDDQKLAVVALQISQRVQQAEGAKPAEPDPGLFQFVSQPAKVSLAGTEGVEVQPHVKAGARFFRERGHETRADLVGRKDIGLHADIARRALNRGDHLVEKHIAFDEKPERALALAEVQHTHRSARMFARLSRCPLI